MVSAVRAGRSADRINLVLSRTQKRNAPAAVGENPVPQRHAQLHRIGLNADVCSEVFGVNETSTIGVAPNRSTARP